MAQRALTNEHSRAEDEVRYAMPFGRLGRIVDPPVRRHLARIFECRRRTVGRLLTGASASRGRIGSPAG